MKEGEVEGSWGYRRREGESNLMSGQSVVV